MISYHAGSISNLSALTKLGIVPQHPVDALAAYVSLCRVVKSGVVIDRMKGVPSVIDRLMVDSAAVGKQIHLAGIDDYIRFLEINNDSITTYVNMDIIDDEEASYKNLKIIESAGLRPIPVFHWGRGEFYWLEKYIDEGYDYIGLGTSPKYPRNISPAGDRLFRMSSPEALRLLDYIWDRYLTDDNGMPLVKVHGFGVSPGMAWERWPWYSVDSTTVIRFGYVGGVMTPFGPFRIKEGNDSHLSVLGPTSELQPETSIKVKELIEKNIPEGYSLDDLLGSDKVAGYLRYVLFVNMVDNWARDLGWPRPFKYKGATGVDIGLEVVS